jgi:hypothetical protein
MRGISGVAAVHVVYQEGLCSLGLIIVYVKIGAFRSKEAE